MSETDFQTYEVSAPAYETVAAEYAALNRELDAAATAPAAIAVVERWESLRRKLYTWSSLVNIRFRQDTRNEAYKRARENCDELEPKLTNLAVAMKRRLTESPHRAVLEQRFGRQAFDLWQCDIASFDPAIEPDLVEQARLVAEYTELLASGKFEFRGETLTLSQLMKFGEHAERDVRHDAATMRWDWFAGREQFDSIFDQLVRIRQAMAEKLGYKNFVDVGYQRMHRVGYAQADVEQFRAQVREHVVPLTSDLRRRQSQTLGIDPLMAWDQEIYDPAGNPQPRGDADWMVERAHEMFAELGGGMDQFFAQMTSRNLIDLKSRPGKGPGGFCDVLPDFEMPFIFANSDGTMSDVTVFTHEMGHAFQCYQSLNQPLFEYVMATEDACEIHSMGLELLSWPQMKHFFGDDAARYCRLHLAKQLLFFPYGVAVDHFQHLIYANPSATAGDRAAMWQEMEQTYQPSLRWGDLAHPAGGRRWHAQIHIFGYPFYYIDYTLALTCALQLWAWAAEDRDGAMDAYFKLCRRGGEAAFGDLVKSAGLVSPFEEGCLQRAAEHARRELAAL